jgi:hypothetical protein
VEEKIDFIVKSIGKEYFEKCMQNDKKFSEYEFFVPENQDK